MPDVKRIPDVPAARILELNKKLRPYVRRDALYEIVESTDLWGESYHWDPKLRWFKQTGLVQIGHFVSYHTYGYQGFFKPTVAEVLAQFPPELVEKACGYEIWNDLDKIHILPDGHHWATVIVYGKR